MIDGVSWLTESSSTMTMSPSGESNNMDTTVAAPAIQDVRDDDSVAGTVASSNAWVDIASQASAGGTRAERVMEPKEIYHLPSPWPLPPGGSLTWTKASPLSGASSSTNTKRSSSPASSSVRPPRGSTSPRSKDNRLNRAYGNIQLIAERNRNLKSQLKMSASQVEHIASLNLENARESQAQAERAEQLRHELGIYANGCEERRNG